MDMVDTDMIWKIKPLICCDAKSCLGEFEFFRNPKQGTVNSICQSHVCEVCQQKNHSAPQICRLHCVHHRSLQRDQAYRGIVFFSSWGVQDGLFQNGWFGGAPNLRNPDKYAFGYININHLQGMVIANPRRTSTTGMAWLWELLGAI